MTLDVVNFPEKTLPNHNTFLLTFSQFLKYFLRAIYTAQTPTQTKLNKPGLDALNFSPQQNS